MGKAVTRDELKTTLDGILAEQNRRHQEGLQERNRLHAENREAFKEIREDIRELGRRAFGNER